MSDANTGTTNSTMTEIDDFLVNIDPRRPLLLLDADEVLLRFVEHLESHLPTVGFELRLESFQLSGNIYSVETAKAAEPHEVKELISGFFEHRAHDVPLVPGVREALDMLAPDYEMAVLSNVPAARRDARLQNLRAHGINLPVLANRGEKGPAAASIAARHRAPIIFVDDLPPQHKSVAHHAPDVHRVHFVADPRLAALIGPSKYAHARIDTWPELTHYLQRLLTEA